MRNLRNVVLMLLCVQLVSACGKKCDQYSTDPSCQLTSSTANQYNPYQYQQQSPYSYDQGYSDPYAQSGYYDPYAQQQQYPQYQQPQQYSPYGSYGY